MIGFALDAASAFTGAYTRRWGNRCGRWVTVILGNLLGVPLWVVGLGLAVRTPSPPLFAALRPIETLGWTLIGLGCVLQIAALLSLRLKAAAPSAEDTLVDTGIYSRIRHPIYAGIFLEFTALMLIKPILTVAVASTVGIIWAALQARLEELDLLRRIPAYRCYVDRVPRFIPRTGRKASG